MTNILMSLFSEKEEWSSALEKYLAGKKVFILAFSFAAEYINSPEEWIQAYGQPEGEYYTPMLKALTSYGVGEEEISWGNYFEDSPRALQAKINEAEVLFLPGGAPDEFFDRLKEKNLIDAIQQFKGTILGFSAGAMVQIQDFHIIEDDHYKEYSYHEGLDLLTDFDVEVHFEKDDSTMQASIQRCLKEKKKVVYGIRNAGAVIVEGDSILTLGEVEKYEKKPQ